MSDELITCAAAFFRVKGKDVVTEKEFTMSLTLDYKWLSIKEADNLMKILLAKGIVVKNNGYLKATPNLSTVQVPIAYRPSDDLKKSLSGTIEIQVEKPSTRPAPAAGSPNLFVEMMGIAESLGIPKSRFVSESNILKKKLGVDTTVASLIILRDAGADIGKLKDRVYTQVLGKV